MPPGGTNEQKREGRSQSVGSWKAEFRYVLSCSRKYFYAGPDKIFILIAAWRVPRLLAKP